MKGLIRLAGDGAPVVVLIDEYDKRASLESGGGAGEVKAFQRVYRKRLAADGRGERGVTGPTGHAVLRRS